MAERLRVDYAVMGERNWATNALRFDNEQDAEAEARGRYARWTLMRGWRIVPENTPDREPINEAEVQS